MQADEILEQLGEGQGALPFLSNDGRMHLADARLTVFRSPEKWAVFFEIPHYSDGADAFCNWAGGVGNCLVEGDWTWASELWGDLPFELLEPKNATDTATDDCGPNSRIDRAQFSVRISGEQLDFSPTTDDYAAAGIMFEDEATGAGSLQPGQLLRYLCHQLDHPFFAPEAEMHKLLNDAPDLELWLQTRHWHHPVYLVDSHWKDDVFDEDRIRNIEGFAILARAIASGDLSEWHAQNPATSNTDWNSLEAIRRANS